MKTTFLTFGILLFFLTNGLAQKDKFELGVYIAPSFSFYEKSDVGSNNKFATGFYYNAYSNKLFGFGAGVDYHQLNLNVKRRIGQENKFNFLKFPVWARFNTNYHSSAITRAYFLAGAAYGNLLNVESATDLYNLKGLKQNHFFINFGLQLKRPLNEDYQFTLGTHLDVTNIYDTRYGYIYSFQVVFGVGRIWK
jgi:hypothetical protein